MRLSCFVLFLSGILIAGTARAQHRIGVGYGYATREQFMNLNFSIYKTYSSTDDGALQPDIARDALLRTEPVYFYDRKRSGAWSLRYDYSFGRYFSLGISAAYEEESSGLRSRDGASARDINVGKYRRQAFTLAPEVAAAYTPPGPVRVYGLVGMGATFIGESIRGAGGRKELDGNYYAFQLSPFCMRFGNTVSGWFEMGFGYKGILSVGAAYRF